MTIASVVCDLGMYDRLIWINPLNMGATFYPVDNRGYDVGFESE